ncbi:hypothetical protein DL96DRAFT_423323 [Flagelloscypha sp. PMI_526]|nr:hypothetical protein DL96DRAFT_423323 [Flagelloscypha sp. PMI_526]
MRFPLIFLTFISTLVSFVYGQSPPYNFSPFLNTGDINALTVTDPTDPLSGGTITVDGLTYVVPKNLLVTLPSIAVAWPELFDSSQNPKMPQFGTVSWQATVYGNRVGDDLIAGLIYIAQTQNQLIQGFVSAINTDSGHFRVAGNFADGSTGIDCVLNDPVGRYAKTYTDNPLWTVDADNPSVRTMTGVPMCIPRSADDPDCLASQRPNGETHITFGAPPVAAGQPDPTKMIPLMVGDYVTISGTEVGGGLLAVYSLQANIGAYTAPGTKPAYATVEEALFAVVAGAANTEDAETRAVAFSSDTSASIQWYAIDVDRCTGEEKERKLILQQVQGPGDDPEGRAVFRGGKQDFSPATREVGFRLSTGTSDGPGGIIAGQFIQPIMEYTMPELVIFGDNLPQHPFQLMPYLVNGAGPYESGDYLATPLATPALIGQLNPWPGRPIAAPDACPPPTNTTDPTTTTDTTTPPTQTPTGPDTVTILTATVDNGQSTSRVVCTALTTDPTAKLTFSSIGNNPINATPMTSLGNGQWTISISASRRPTTAVVTSDKGGSAQQAFTRI